MTKNELLEIIGQENASVLKKPCMKQDFHLPYATWKKRLISAFVMKHPKQMHILQMACDALGKDAVQWRDMTKLNLRTISHYINTKVAPNTANTYIHVLMAFLNEYTDEKYMPVNSLRGTMRSKTVPSQHVALTLDELGRFDSYKPKSVIEQDVKTLFMRAAYTGARCSDAYLLSMDNVSNGILSYVSKKTSVEADLPVHKNLPKYLEYHITKEYSGQTTKTVVQRICKAIGINSHVSLFVGGKRKEGEKWAFVTMHSARRTFCTVLAAMGVPIEQIRAMAGHSSSLMTSRYVCLDGRNPGENAMRFFQGKTA